MALLEWPTVLLQRFVKIRPASKLVGVFQVNRTALRADHNTRLVRTRAQLGRLNNLARLFEHLIGSLVRRTTLL
jgi:hypothetical protein